MSTAFPPQPVRRGEACVLCGSSQLRLLRRGNITNALTPSHFSVTDRDDGRTADLFRCDACGLQQCANMGDPLEHYVQLEDAAYEAGRPQRALQMRALLRRLAAARPNGTLLDIGAATGILVEEARAMGFQAVGVEPSQAFQQSAQKRGLPVTLGIFPHAQLPGPFDAITLVDVIEHVTDPLQLMRDVAAALSPGGVTMLVTPDVRSLAARLMGRRWWHYRAAHITYFSRATLARLLAASGLELVSMRRAGWVFALNYLLERCASYLPGGLRLRLPGRLGTLSVPLNLGDSLCVIARRPR